MQGGTGAHLSLQFALGVWQLGCSESLESLNKRFLFGSQLEDQLGALLRVMSEATSALGCWRGPRLL